LINIFIFLSCQRRNLNFFNLTFNDPAACWCCTVAPRSYGMMTGIRSCTRRLTVVITGAAIAHVILLAGCAALTAALPRHIAPGARQPAILTRESSNPPAVSVVAMGMLVAKDSNP
jgi:hypothetical protein